MGVLKSHNKKSLLGRLERTRQRTRALIILVPTLMPGIFNRGKARPKEHVEGLFGNATIYSTLAHMLLSVEKCK